MEKWSKTLFKNSIKLRGSGIPLKANPHPEKRGKRYPTYEDDRNKGVAQCTETCSTD